MATARHPAAQHPPAQRPATPARRLGTPPAPAELSPPERLSVDELRARQLAALQWTLRHAYTHVPLYRRKFDAAGVHPDDCRELADLAHFPHTTKDDLRGTYPFGTFAVARERVRRVHASSGTTGTPTVVGYTDADLDTWATVMARSLYAAGARPGHLVHVAYGYGLFTGGLGAHYGAERLGATVVPASGGATARQVRLIADLRPEVIMATPSYLLTLLDALDRQGVDPRATSLRVGVLGAEPWTEAMRAEIEARTRLHAVDVYGLSEVMGPGVAQECVETKDGPHVWEDHFYPEVVDPADGRVLAEGETGELVFTTLTREATPVIRYRTRDLTALRPGTARPAFRRMDRVTGRSDDLIVLRGVNVFPTQVEEAILTTAGLAPHFQLVLDRPHRLDRLTVRVEVRPDAAAEERATAGARLTARVRDLLGVAVDVDVLAPDALERSTGKLARLLDRRPPAGAGPRR